MPNFLMDLSYEELNNLLKEMGEKSYRTEQIFKSLHLGFEIDEISNISKELRAKLSDKFIGQAVKIVNSICSKDGTEKFLFSLFDDNVIEGVLMRYKYGATLCVSTQVGCRMNCAFCASGLDGLIRNLNASEILGQVICVNRYLQGALSDKRKITNVVLMGSGEPLDNYDNVIRFIRLVSSEHGINISPRNISLSTSGIVPKMYDLANENLQINLTVSLHAAFDEDRKKIMPVANKYSIEQIVAACQNYFEKTGRRYIFEYVIIKGNNDSDLHVEKLIQLLKGKPCHVNLIRLNKVKEKDLSGVNDKVAYRFMDKLINGGLSATVRRRMGDDIEGACGQLRRKFIARKKEEENERN